MIKWTTGKKWVYSDIDEWNKESTYKYTHKYSKQVNGWEQKALAYMEKPVNECGGNSAVGK